MAAKLNARAQSLLDVGAKLSAKYGPSNVTRRMVANEAGVSEALVSNYMGGAVDAQKAYKKHAAKLGLKLPDAATEKERGLELRAHGPRAAKRSAARKPILPPLGAAP